MVFWKIFNNPIRTYYGRGPLSKQADIIDDSNDGFVTIKVDIDENYLKDFKGFPNSEFPSDHLPILSQFEFIK